MAVIDYSNVTKATLTNISTANVTFQLYRVNLWKTIIPGDSIILNIDTSEEAVYYANLGGYPSSVTEDVYTLLTEEPDDWSTNYTDYYVKSGDDFVENSDSTWATDTFYAKSEVTKYDSIGAALSVEIG